MSLESFWYGDRLVAQPHMAAANSCSLEGNALLEDIRQRLEQELPTTSYMEQETLAQLIRVREPLHKSPTHVLAHACRVRQHLGPCSNLILA